MAVDDDDARGDLARLRVPLAGALTETGDVFDPFRLVDGGGQPVVPVTEFLRNLQAAGRSEATQRSYGMDLLRWFRFAWAAGFAWDQATRAEARDFCRWLQLSGKPEREHWRTGRPAGPGAGPAPGTVNAVTGKASPGPGYAAATVAHCETVCRSFYDYHLETGAGPLANPFPLARKGPRANAHHNPMLPFRQERAGLFRPRQPKRIPRGIPDRLFDELFASLPSDRDRALVAFWVSTGARASELLGVTRGSTDPGSQLVTVIRKGSRAMQPLSASPDAFVWLRLYQEETHGLVPSGLDDPLWWTLRRPFRPLSYHAARAMFTRAGASLGANWSLHDIRHCAAYRMARDPEMPITDVRAVGLGSRAPVHDSDLRYAHGRGRHRERGRAPPPPGRAAGPAAAPGRAGLPARVAGRAVREARVTAPGTETRQAGTPLRPRMRPEAASALLGKFPPRTLPDTWEATALGRAALTGRLLAPPYTETPWQLNRRRLALRRFLGWLERHPGDTWQQSWQASGIAGDGTADWRPEVMDWLTAAGDPGNSTVLLKSVTLGLGQLIYADAIRPGTQWLVSSPIRFPLGREMPRLRDSAGFGALKECADRAGISHDSCRLAVEDLSVIIAAKGGTLADITVGDCLELAEARDASRGRRGKGIGFYPLLHATGLLPADAPATLRMFDPRFQGQLTTAELIGQYDLACAPVRDLLVSYLNERQPAIDYATLKQLAYLLGKLFWKDLETHNPGISSLRLAPDAAIAWKRRLQVKTVTARDAAGNATQSAAERIDVAGCLTAVRGFYLDITQRAAEDPARWAQWAATSPVRREDISAASKTVSRRKSRMDQRTRERIPVLPALISVVDQGRKNAAARLAAATAAAPGDLFTAAGATLRRTALTSIAGQANGRTWAEDPVTGTRRDLTREESTAFWTWAAVEVLRATGIRVEELTELSHHSLVQYRLPSAGELIPLLHIAPSKTDVERLLVISPVLADVLAAVIARVRDSSGTVPLVIAYDVHECEFTPPMPVLFQHRVGADSRPISDATIRRWITGALEGTGITDASGQLLAFKPHDFRRIRDRRDHERNAPAHLPALDGALQHHHDHGIQGRLSRRSDQRPPGVHRPPPRTAARRRIPFPDRLRVGRVPRPLRTPPSCPRRLRTGLGIQLHP